jgi:hypothetical protein
VSQVPDASLHTSHALYGPRQTLRALTRFSALFVLASGPLTPSPSALETCVPYALYRGCIKLQRVRSLLRAAWFPVYASTVLFGSVRTS